MATQWLQRTDVDVVMGPARFDSYFDDVGAGVADLAIFEVIAKRAEDKCLSILLRGYKTVAEVVTLMQNDAHLRGCSAMICAEYASRRKGDFVSEDGKGRYYQDYKEAIDALEKLSKAQERTRVDESPGGVNNVNQGGNVFPTKASRETPTFTFAPEKGIRQNRGRF